MQPITIGLDLAKSVFQVHGVDHQGQVVLSRRLRRAEVRRFFSALAPCLIGMEACSTAHHWARELLALGHDVKLMPPAYVKAYVRRQKNDAADAQAICEAVTRPSMRFVPIKTVEQQSVLVLHRCRDLLMGQRTSLINALRAHLAEFGIVAPEGAAHVKDLVAVVTGDTSTIAPLVRAALEPLVTQLGLIEAGVQKLDREILGWHRTSEVSRRLETVPGIGVLTASALAVSIADPAMFASGREFAAFLGMVPRQNSSGGKDRLGRITKMGDRYLRRLLITGAHAVLRISKMKPGSAVSDARRAWVLKLLARRPFKVAAVALANKMARIAWAVLARGGKYDPTAGLSVTA